jgi:hypothetical protein
VRQSGLKNTTTPTPGLYCIVVCEKFEQAVEELCMSEHNLALEAPKPLPLDYVVSFFAENLHRRSRSCGRLSIGETI